MLFHELQFIFQMPASQLMYLFRKDFVNNKSEFDFWYDKLLKLPMYFAKFEPATALMKITEVIKNQFRFRKIRIIRTQIGYGIKQF